MFSRHTILLTGSVLVVVGCALLLGNLTTPLSLPAALATDPPEEAPSEPECPDPSYQEAVDRAQEDADVIRDIIAHLGARINELSNLIATFLNNLIIAQERGDRTLINRLNQSIGRAEREIEYINDTLLPHWRRLLTNAEERLRVAEAELAEAAARCEGDEAAEEEDASHAQQNAFNASLFASRPAATAGFGSSVMNALTSVLQPLVTAINTLLAPLDRLVP